MREQPYDGLSLFGQSGNRKYLNALERQRFMEAASRAPPGVRLFCLTLGWSGARISEVLALTPASFDIESDVASVVTLKRRKRGIVRQVPLPQDVLDELDRQFKLSVAQRDLELANQRIWRFSRTTAWRYHRHARHAQGACGMASASRLFSRTCRRISFSAGLATPRVGPLQSKALHHPPRFGLFHWRSISQIAFVH